jgi:NADH-quinone oxidoreductase subunit N
VNYLEVLRLLAPETVVALTALLVLGVDLTAMQAVSSRLRTGIAAMISTLGCLLAIAWMFALPEHGRLFGGVVTVDPVSQIVKAGILVLAISAMVLSLDRGLGAHAGEYFALLLFSAVGMMFLVGSEDILMIFVSLELTSLTLYILAAFDPANRAAAEAALKYFLFGGMSAAVTLFGLSLLYGLAGSTSLPAIGLALASQSGAIPLALLAMVMVAAGFAFKVAAAPFHLWAPDAYQGAPIPSAAFIASGSKLAGFVVFAKVAALGLVTSRGHADAVRLLLLLAGASMLVGNLAALAQSNVRRLLAYSAVAHAGYLLLGVLAAGPSAMSSLIYYAFTYALAAVGAFGVVAIVEGQTGNGNLAAFAGLGKRSPLVSASMMVFLLSLAGVPPFAGFFGKFYLFSFALQAHPGDRRVLGLVLLAIGLSAVSLYYYLQVLKQAYVVEAPVDSSRIPVGATSTRILTGLLALAVLLLGCWPDLLLGPLGRAVAEAGR